MSDTSAPTPPDAPSAPSPDEADLAPRPRPGYRSARPPGVSAGMSATAMAALFAGVVRTVVGLLGFGAALLFLPVHIATPVLAGVSVLLVVTGNVSVWRAIDGSRALRLIFRSLAALSLVTLLGITAATAIWGAGALRPRPPPPPDDGPPTVRFQMDP